MARHFDIEKKRNILLGPSGLRIPLEMCREPIEKLRADRVLTARSCNMLNEAAMAIVVGLPEQALQLVEKALEYVFVAIEDHERPMYYSPRGTEAGRYACKGLALWLLGRPIDQGLVDSFVADSTEYLLGEGKDRVGIGLSLADYAALGAYEPALDVWHRCGKFERPSAVRRIAGEANMCFVVANHRLGRDYSAEDEGQGLDSFLKRNVNTVWLARNQATRMATWMKIAYWQPGDDPFETVRRCHQFLR